ncbi:hypothetical protein BJ322DRAFT_43497 [Thelephora terrestris]|uniref:Uncharacterized protein n=1 Tax=Thelephora terrestris TaxID=56493 RepID=A0A9P6HQ53_9AGAM|nr:hypothetical protein BJ322DRAFT_43497 [Thelephora terrestris]
MCTSNGVYSVALELRCVPPYKARHRFDFSSTHSTDSHPSHLDHLLSLSPFYSQNWNLVKMCHNIIDGRYYTTCGHFDPVSTRLQDCLKPDCLFSRRHEHAIGTCHFVTSVLRRFAHGLFSLVTGCKSTLCRRMMSLPVRNPIRIFESNCGNCVICNPLLTPC